ncbi:MAG TPA: hypothetical protein VFP97_07255 [Chitinophagaceae bacterium]|nr:hypothetical protein [Chitinophagaceae bacterium]
MKQTLKTMGLRVSLGILLCASALTSTAQNSGPLSKIYLQTGAGGGSHKSNDFDLGVKTILNDKWSMNLSYKSLEMRPKNLPSDYQPETGYIFFIPYTTEVTSNMSLVSLTAGRYFKLGKNFWATTEGGLSYVKGEKVNFDRTQVTSSNIIIVATTTSNYSTTKENRSAVGAMFQADVNWAFASFMGLGAGVYTNINSIQSPVGFNVKLLIGKMGKEKKHKH